MQASIGVGVAAVAAGLIAASAVALQISAVALLVSSARRDTARRRHAHHVLALGAGTAAVGVVAGLTGAVGNLSRSDGLPLADVIPAGLALSVLVLCAGLLLLPGAAATPAAALRLALDGLLISSALCFVAVVLLTEPTRVLGDATPAARPGLLAAAAGAVLAAGLVVALVVRRPPDGAALAGCGVVVTAVSGLVLSAAASLVVALAGVAGSAVGLLLVALGGRVADTSGPGDGDVPRRDGGWAFVPILVMALAAVHHLLVGGGLTVLGAVAWIAAGFALAARQYLATLDVREFADRLAEREACFRELFYRDPLTGLANRRGLLAELERIRPGEGGVLLCIDLDGFTTVNDTRGHDIGDLVLREVGARLAQTVRPGDLAARLDGDGFAVLMRAATPQEAERVAGHLLSVLGRPYPHPSGPVLVSASVGLAACSGATDGEALLRNADLALRFAKQRGRNRVEHYDVAYDRWLRRRTRLESDLRDAAARGELRLAFQPVVAVPSVRPVGAEALLRWDHPDLGAVRPDEFIPLAEERGLIGQLGAWVLDQACGHLARWLAAGYDVWVSVNVSPRELHDPEYVPRVARTLRAHRVPPQRLVIEVTEHAVATDLAEMVRRLHALRAIGVRIALDDFGAGYSSLGQLRNLPIDILKIDHSLVAEPEPAGGDERGEPPVAPMVDVVVRLGHQLGLEVIAEGVRTQAEFAAVAAAGCRFGQGQLFGWGVPAEHLEAMLEAAASAALRTPVRMVDEGQVATPTAGTGQALVTSHAQHVGTVDSGHEMRKA